MEGEEYASVAAELMGLPIEEKKIQAMVDAVYDIQKMGEGEYVLQKLNLDDLKTLDEIVRTLKQAVNRVNQFHTEQIKEGVKTFSLDSIEEINSRKKIYEKDDDENSKQHFDKLKLKTLWNHTTPLYAFNRLGEHTSKIFKALMDGQDKQAFLAQKVKDFAESVYTNDDYEYF